jgi:hypothetical protein
VTITLDAPLVDRELRDGLLVGSITELVDRWTRLIIYRMRGARPALFEAAGGCSVADQPAMR